MENNSRTTYSRGGQRRGGYDNTDNYRGSYRGRGGANRGGYDEGYRNQGYTVKQVRDGKFENTQQQKPSAPPEVKPQVTLKKQGATTYVQGFDTVFAGSGWGDAQQIVFEEPPKKEEPKKVEEPPKIIEESKAQPEVASTKITPDESLKIQDKTEALPPKKEYRKKVDQPSKQPDIEQVTETKSEPKPEETKVEEVKTEPEPPKVPVKSDFVPDENFSWNLDLEAIATKEARKKKATNNFIPAVIKTDPTQIQSKGLGQDLKLKIKENLEFSLTQLDKICSKGFTNDSNCCFMNVCLQSLLSSPAFFNMLIAIGSNKEIMQELEKQGDGQNLLSKFVHLARYFNPRDQLDSSSIFSSRTVNAEKIFQGLIGEFNPFSGHQDCHEFLVLILDKLHDEMALIYKEDLSTKEDSKNVDEWHETGHGNQQKTFNNEQGSLTQASMIRDIFGGLLRTEFHVEGRKNCTVTFEPFFALNLEISRCEDLESCLSSYFRSKYLDDYKDEAGKFVKAYHQQLIEKLPNILILQLKRFVYRERPIKLKDDIEFPEVLTIEDKYVSTQFQAKTGGSKNAFNNDYTGRQYRLFSAINHRGIEASKGHYVSWALDSHNQWMLYDDNKVKKAPNGIDSVLNSQAYLLFYEKIVDQ